MRPRINGKVELEEGVSLGPGVRIDAHAPVRIRRNARVGERAVIVAHAGVEIGEGAVIGAWAAIEDARPTYDDAETPIRRQPLAARPLSVGAGARIGPHASIQANVPAGAEIPAYAVVRDAASES